MIATFCSREKLRPLLVLGKSLIVFLYDDFFSLFQATSRAILGEKAYEYLKKGKQIPDQLLVDITVDAIR